MRLVLQKRDPQSGQALVEYAIVFPLQLMITLAIIQLAHIFVAKQVLEYSAFCGARAAVVGLSDDKINRAITIPISSIAGTSHVDGTTSAAEVDIPGWGLLKGSGNANNGNTTNTIATELENGVPVIDCNVQHYFQLSVPVGNVAVYALGDVFLGVDDLVRNPAGDSFLMLRANCKLARPWADN